MIQYHILNKIKLNHKINVIKKDGQFKVSFYGFNHIVNKIYKEM